MADASSYFPTIVITLVTALCSGGVVAVGNLFVSRREQSVFRRQKLEELHQAVFAITFKIEARLLALSMELQIKKSLLADQSRASANRAQIEECNIRIETLREAIPRQELADNLETVVFLIPRYFRELEDERGPLGGLVQSIINMCAFKPNAQFGQEDQAAFADRIAHEASNIGHRVSERIWALGKTRFFHW